MRHPAPNTARGSSVDIYVRPPGTIPMAEVYDIGLGRDDCATRKRADADYLSFWEEQAAKLSWFREWDTALEWKAPFARWFAGGRINASHNALDIHQEGRSSKTAIIWEGEDGSVERLTYGDLLERVCRAAGMLRSLGVESGDRVAIYLPMIPQLLVAMLACARIGAIHTVIFSGFSAASLRGRLEDSGASVVITADGGFRRGRVLDLKGTVDAAVAGLDSVRSVIVCRRTGSEIAMGPRDRLWDDLLDAEEPYLPATELDSAHPLFILYTSGTTGRPKGVLHGTGGYLTHLHSTFRWAFDIGDEDVYFCTADIGWVTGHSYVVYGPLLHGATQVIYEGAPDYPDSSRIWEMMQRHGVTILYTTPTALRMFMKAGDAIPDSFDLSRLRLLGSVGEPINPEVWRWYYRVIGGGRCPVIDTWWQTETGGMMISALPGLETIPLKPGSGTLPIPGTDIAVLDEKGRDTPAGVKGYLAIRRPWPGMLLTLWGNDEKYREVYWSRYPGCYYPGDYAMRDADGYLWLLGRADDVLKVAGHRIGTAEVESSIVSHPAVAESAVCGVPDEIKGESIAAFVVLRDGTAEGHGQIRREISETVRNGVGPIAVPGTVHFLSGLPKTRSGKIMRRLLRAMACGQQIGDVSTLEDGEAVDEVRRTLGGAKSRD